MKNKVIFILTTVFVIAISGCNKNMVLSDIEEIQTEPFDYEEAYQITDADRNTEADMPISIDLTQQPPITKIEEGGDYILSGNYEGQILIDAEDQMVHLILNGVDVTSYKGPAMYVKSAGKVIVSLADGTENTWTDSTDYSEYNDSEACIFSTSDLTINGSGTMYVYGYYKDSIRSRDIVKILGGNLYVQSKSDGIRGNDGIVLMPQMLSVECEGKGIYTTKTGKREKGFIDICGGELNLIAGEYAISSAADVSIRECRITSKSVIADISCDGTKYIEEGCLVNE